MSNRHLAAARTIVTGSPGAHAILVQLADCACDKCGMAWPGVSNLMRWTEMGETSVRKALDLLRDKGLVDIHAYPKGGRGRATEYVVLPHLGELSPAPCGECRQRMVKPFATRGV